jgi:hypothetical protein
VVCRRSGFCHGWNRSPLCIVTNHFVLADSFTF